MFSTLQTPISDGFLTERQLTLESANCKRGSERKLKTSNQERIPGTKDPSAQYRSMLFICVTFRRYNPSSFFFFLSPWIIWNILISEVFCGLEEICKSVFLTRCHLIVSVDFNAMLDGVCVFMSSHPRGLSDLGAAEPWLWLGRRDKLEVAAYQLESQKQHTGFWVQCLGTRISRTFHTQGPNNVVQPIISVTWTPGTPGGLSYDLVNF